VLVNLTPVQNFLARKASVILAEKLKTKVTVDRVRIDFLNHLLLKGVYVEGQSHDTLLYAGEVEIRITDWFLFNEKPVIHYVGLHNTYAHLYRNAHSVAWNYDFIADAFSSDNSKKSAGKPIEFDLKKIELENVRFHMDDKWGGEDIDIDAGSILVNADDIDFKKKLITVHNITIDNTAVLVNEYKAGHPPRPLGVSSKPAIDTTPFNGGGWKVKSSSLALNGCSFYLTGNELTTPVPGLFDQDHMAITNIKAAVNTINIVGDTITGNVTNLFVHERSGLEIRKMTSKVSVSPIASICNDLYLETNNSKIRDYYAMHYKRFPDFLEYIDSVVMVGRLKDASVDVRDIAFFAPELKKFPQMLLRISGKGKGTVANLSAQNLIISDGGNVVKGDLTMKGLPNIYKTKISYTNGQIVTSGKGILRYVPGLRNSPDVALDRVSFAYFTGNYEGYIEDFSVKGKLRTNLGDLTMNVAMNIPGFNGNTAVYTGTVITDNLQLGIFLKQPLLGAITMSAGISGSSFNADKAYMNLNGEFKELNLNNYTYHNVSANGTLEKKEFTGKLLVDDPNLALEFDGGFNYSNKNINIKAQAHLLGTNLNALHLTADTITVSADFDLDCTGSNIDNFSGFAKLNNIDMKRNSHKVAVDSVFVQSGGDSLSKLLTVQSNNVLATIKGNYQLSKLPTSFQYYLSRYLPNYIKVPDTTAPDQNFSFKVKTYDIDSIWAVTFPFIKGFDSANFSGSLNTTAQKLTLSAAIPNGTVGNLHMTNIAVSGNGTLASIGVNTTIDNVAVGDSIVNGSLSVTATVADDSMRFTIATTTADTSTAITLNGLVFARKDSLFLNMLPSQFFLNQAKWDISGGGKIVYSNKYLLVEGLSLSSGLQKITASTELLHNDRSILINAENVDLGQLGSWAGLAAYQPDGRLNGTIQINKFFEDLYISSNLKATNVKMGADTVGTVNIIGDYDGAKKLVAFDPQTGIYRDNSSITVSGKISLDSNTHQKLDGKIQFNDAPVAWASPFLAGIMSHLTGTLNGAINFQGSSYEPIMDGNVSLRNAGMRIDYMGCNYTIPSATIHLDNKVISFGTVTAYDAYKNTATITGHFSHNLFKRMRMRLMVSTEKFELMNLTANDNNLFYGNVIAGIDSFTIRGPFDNIRLNAYNAYPAAKSRIFIPMSSSAGGDASTYSYATFKNYGKSQEKLVRKSRDKIHINIDANMNSLAEIHIVLDPVSGDEIMAKGDGQVQLDIPPNNDITMNGIYGINSGYYSLSIRSFFLQRRFLLEAGSTITFEGPFSETKLDVNAKYVAKAKLYDILSDADKQSVTGKPELIEAQTPQLVDVLLHMNGYLNNPKLTYDLDLEDKHSQSSLAYQKLKFINNDDRLKTSQVATLLAFNSFIPPEGIVGSTVASGAINNISQFLSSSTSTALTNLANKFYKNLNVDLKYTNYNYSDQTLGGLNRNEVKLGVNHSYLNDRLLVEVGSTSDWGHATSASATSNFNLTGDFRIQYQLTQTSKLRINAFRTSDYDVTLDQDVVRSGVGLTWRKSFDRLSDFFRGNKYAEKQKTLDLKKLKLPTDDSVKKTSGTQ
jgi:hypothetical protein